MNAAQSAVNSYLHGLGVGGQAAGLGIVSPLGLKSAQPFDRYHSDEEYWQKPSVKKSKKSNIALSALTLLAFLFFLNILQNCIQDHMYEMKGGNKKGVMHMMNMNKGIVSQIVIPTGTGTGGTGEARAENRMDTNAKNAVTPKRVKGPKRQRENNKKRTNSSSSTPPPKSSSESWHEM